MGISDDNIKEILSGIQKALSSGLLYTHTRSNFNTTKTLESVSFLYALIEILNEKGLISIEELDERKKRVAEQVVSMFVESGISLIYQDPEYDKYNYEYEAGVDCMSRLDICRSVCCKLPHALSRQDVREGIIRWEFGRPYLIAHDDDGYCVHLDRRTFRCTVYVNRPAACRGFDCRNTERWHIWQDYDKKIMNPGLIGQINETVGKLYTLPKQ
ncbi:MAG: YkgJ family cysteine cluster protein [Nitrospirota bacterium]